MQLKTVGESLAVTNAINNVIKCSSDLSGTFNANTVLAHRLAEATASYSTEAVKAAISQSTLNKEEIKAILGKKGLKGQSLETATAEVMQAQATNTLSNFQKGATVSTLGLGNAMKGLWSILKAHPLFWISTVLTTGIAIWQSYKQSIEEAVSSANEAATTYKEQSSSINEMVSKYQDLRQQLIAAKGNEEETYSIKQKLLELQTELNEKFGDEYGKLNLLTDAYKDQTDAIKAYNKESAQTFLNENRKGIKESNKQMEKDNTYYLGSMNGLINASELKYLDKIKEIASDNSINFTDTGFEFIGNANEASDSINSFMNQIKELQNQAGNTSSTLTSIFDGILDNSGEALSDANSIIEEYSNLYEQAKLAEIASDDKLSSGYSDLINALTEYNDAITNSKNPYEDKDVQKAYTNLQAVKQGIDANEKAWGKYSDVVQKAYDQADTSAYSFYASIKNNTDGIGDLSNELNRFSDIDLQSMFDDGDNGDSFDKLCDKAKKYGLEVQDVIDLLIKLGVVQGKISTPELETDTLSYETLTKSAESANEATDTLRSAISSVNDALAEQAENGSISIDTMLAMVDAGYATALQFDATTGACTINKEAMLALVQAKIQNQIADLQLLQSNIQQKLADDGNTARESANGFYDLAKAKLTSASAEQLASMKQFNDAEAQINALQNAMKNITKIGSGSYSTKARSSSVGASSASKSAAKTMEEIQREWKEYLSKYLALYKAELDAGLIDLHTFLTKSRSMLDEFYRDGKISAKDYWDSVKDLYESQLSLYDKVLSAVTRRIDKEIDSIHDIIDGLENQNNALQEQLDIYDSVLSEVDRVYDNEIEKLEDQKQAIQDVIDAMSDENDERERAMALQQAQYNLARALSQNSNYIYKDGQFVYTTDETAIREAQDSFKDAQFDIDIAELEKQQDALDDYINVLEQYKNMWAEIADTYQTSQDAINATAILGQNYAQLILQNNLSDITNFKNQYVEIQAQINNNDELIQSYEEKIEYYESLKEQWSDISKAYQQAQEDQYAAMVMGANWESDVLSGRLDVLNNFKEQYIAIQQAITNAALEAARAQAAAQTAQSASGSSGGGSGGNSGSNTTSTPTKSYHVVHKLSNGFKTQGEASSKIGYYDGANGVFKDEDNQWYVYKKETYSSHMFSSISEAKDYIKKELAPWGKYGIIKYAQGTTNAKKGLNLVSEDEYGDELIINHDGTAVIAKGEQFYPFKGGETVINASETKKLLANMSNLVPLQEDASPFSRLKLHPIDYGSMVMNSLNLLDSSALSGNIINRNNSSTIKQEITFHCPNLTDKSGIEYVEHELQSLTTRAMQFDWSK